MIDPSALPDISGGPGLDVSTPGAALEAARRSFPQPIQNPVAPRMPAIPAPRMGKARGGGGGMDLNSLMPLLMLAAPFIEGSSPGYGVGLMAGVMNYQHQQAATRQATVLGLAKEFANVSEEHWPIAEGLMESMGLSKEDIKAVAAAHSLFADPHAQMEREIQEILGPSFIAAQMEGLRPVPTVAQQRALEAAGAPGGYEVRSTPAVPGIPAGGELGTRTPPVAGVPAQEQVVRRGEAPPVPLSDFVAGYRIRQGMDAPARIFLATMQQQVNAGRVTLEQAVRAVDTSPYFISPKDDAARFEKRVETVQKRLEDLATSGRVVGPALQQAVADANAALASDARNSGQTFQGLDTNTIQAKAPKPVSVAFVNPQTGATEYRSFPPGTEVRAVGAGPQQRHLLIYPDGRRELLPPGVVPTNVPARTGKAGPYDAQIAKADADIAGAWKYAQGAFAAPIVQAMQRYTQGRGLPTDQGLLTNAKDASGQSALMRAQAIMNLMGQRDSYAGRAGAKPGATALGIPAPSAGAISMPAVYGIWKQTGKPVPKDIWGQLSPADQQYLTQSGVTHE